MRLLLIAAVILLSCGCLSAQGKTDIKRWIRQDRLILDEYEQMFSDKKITISEFYGIKKISFDTIKVFENLLRVSGNRGGGYTSFQHKAFIQNDSLLSYELSVYGDAAERLINNEDEFGIVPDFFNSRKDIGFDEGLIQINKNYFDVSTKIGRDISLICMERDVQINKLSDLVRKSYYLLMNPFFQLSYGHSCGVAGTTLAGRKALENISDYNPEYLGRVIEGFNIGGRAYAFEQLLKSEIIDKSLALKISKSKSIIVTCNGCFRETLKFEDIYRRYSK